MTREQAQAIMKNIDLIRHFAEGGEIGHRLINSKGEQVAIHPSQKIVLANLTPHKHCLYVRLKPRLQWNSHLQTWVHKPRFWPTTVREEDIIKEPA